MFEENFATLNAVCAEKSVIRPVSRHRLPDGSMDIAGNLKLWNEAIVRFAQIPLWENGTPGYDDRDPLQPEPSLIFIPAPQTEKPRGTVLIAHGGGFETRTGCEGFHAAQFFTQAGFNTAILTYRLRPYSRYDAQADMQRAIRLLRSRASELQITQRVAAMGFSAGGMLSGNCATHFDFGNPDAADPVERMSCRPDAAVLCYAAFATCALPSGFLWDPFGQKAGSPFVDNRDDQVYFAPEVNITRKTPPFFIWQTNSDDPRNAFALGQALTAVGIPFEMHLFPMGVHGLAMADGCNDLSMDLPHVAQWGKLCAQWLEDLGL